MNSNGNFNLLRCIAFNDQKDVDHLVDFKRVSFILAEAPSKDLGPAAT